MAHLPDLTDLLPGRVFGPGESAYDAARPLYAETGAPAVVVRPRSRDDVVIAVQMAADADVPLSVRCGGHSPTGSATNTGGVVLDLADLADVVVDGDAVHVGGGARWVDVADALGPSGRAVTSGDTTTVGVGGLALGGGIGWLVRSHGLTVDVLRGAEVVTADGQVLDVDAGHHPDLFWALRGGGGNFGVVTRFTFATAPVDGMVGGRIVWERSALRGALGAWRDTLRAAPETWNSTLFAFPPMVPGMPDGPFARFSFRGSEGEARDVLRLLLDRSGLLDVEIGPVAYADLLDEAPPGKPPFALVGGNGFVPDLSDDALDAVARALDREIPTVLVLRALGGAYSRVDQGATAVAHRDAEAFLAVNGVLPLDAPDEAVAAARVPTDAALRFTVGTYGNFTEETGPAVLRAMYPPATLERLVAVKVRYDPDDVFGGIHRLPLEL